MTRTETRHARWPRLSWGWIALPVVLAGAAVGGAWLVPGPEPPEPGVLRRVAELALADADGRVHSPADWRDDPAVVLVFLGVECPVSNGYAPEMRRLAEHCAARGVPFHGVHPDPGVTPEEARRHADEFGLDFTLLLDPHQELAEQVGATVTPEAVVLDAQGIVRYRGRIDDRYGPERRRRPSARSHDLRAALDAVLAGREPDVAETEAFGCPMPEPGAAATDEPIVYTRHVAPILWSRCAGCHRPGEVAPFSLLSYHDAAKRADFLADVTADRRMPPWRARHDFGTFRDELHLSGRERAILAHWAAAGAPEGDPADLPPRPVFPDGWQLGEPDLVLTMPEPFQVPPDEDLYRAFVLPIPVERVQGLAAVEYRPGNRAVAHHARLYVDASPDCRRRDQADPGPGFLTVGGADIPKPPLGAWTPGCTPRQPPTGIGLNVAPGSDLVLLVHYHGTGKPETDQSRVGLYFARAPITRSMYQIPLSTARIDIPPGEPRHRIAQHATLPADVKAYSVMPHGHLLMRDMKLWAERPDGTIERLLWIDDWDFTWQGLYHFAEPVALPRGTRLHVVAHYDNSTGNPWNPNIPPVRVRYGPTSRDEMFGCYIQILPDTPADEQAVRRKRWQRSL